MELENKTRFTWWMAYENYIRSVVLTQSDGGLKSISHWRNRIFFKILVYVTPLILVALIPGISMAFSRGFPIMGCAGLLAYLLLAAIIVNRRLSIRIRKLIFISVFYSLSVGLIYYSGKASSGLLFLLALTIFSTVIYSSSAGYYSACINTAICICFWILNYFDPSILSDNTYTPGAWAAVTVNLVLLSFACVKCLDLLFKKLTISLLENKKKRAEDLIVANKELMYQNDEKEKRAAELIIANKELIYQNEEKEKRAAELVIANKELMYQNGEKEKRAAELIIANEELIYQNEEKEKRAAELVIANKELMYQNNEKEKRAAELTDANKQLLKARKQKEFARNNLKALINNTDDLMWSVDKQFNIITSNEPFNETFHLTSGKSVSERSNALSAANYSPEKLERYKAYYERAFAGESFTEIEPAGEPTESWSEISFFPILKVNEIIGTACHSRDITERKKKEEERSRMSADIIQRSKNLEQFAYIVSHNLRAPVAHILGISGILKGALSEADRTKAQNYLFSAVEKMDEVIFDLNKILSVKSEIMENKEPVNFLHLTNDIRSGIENLIQKENVQIVTDFESVDETKTLKSYLHSIFYNLLSNSIKYRQAGKPPVIEIRSSIENDRIKISFKDNGTGLDLNKHGKNLFGLYKRFHDHVEGKGIGLFMIKTQLEALGGSIHVISEPNKGAEFIIDLPR